MKVAALVSGGVDSSLALRLLKEQGHDVTAFYIKIWLEEDSLAFSGDCPWENDLYYVRKLCERENIPLKIVSLQKEYHDNVVSYLIEQVKAGKTPNPDVLCNKRIKFGAFFDKIKDEDVFDKIATGHYARIEEKDNKFFLKTAVDALKDQTYFLSHLSQDQLSRAMFPIGSFSKTEVREFAKKYDLPSKERKDSQGICFLGKIKFKEFLLHHVGVKEGDIVEAETGKKLGTHDGFWYHTIGQRKGLSLSNGPWYVVSKDPEKNIVYVSNQYYSEDKKRDLFNVGQCHWIDGKRPSGQKFLVKIRHGEAFYNATLQWDLSSEKNGTVTIDERDQGIAPGQFAVFYEKRSAEKDYSLCLGCGVIQ